MKTYILDTLNRYKRFSEKLDVKAILCNKSWWIFNDSGEKEVYIFQEDGSLIISFSGKVTQARWQYIPANKSLILSTDKEGYMLHPAFVDENIFALQQDGTNKFAFMIDESQKSNFAPKSLRELTSYFEEKERKRIQEEQRRQQLYIEEAIEQKKRQQIESLKKEAERLWETNREQILEGDKGYIAYQKKQVWGFIFVRILPIIASVLTTIWIFWGMEVEDPNFEGFHGTNADTDNIYEFIAMIAASLILIYIMSLFIFAIISLIIKGDDNFNLEKKKNQYIDNYVRTHQPEATQ